MSALAGQIGDAVVVALNTPPGFSQPFTAVRQWRAKAQLTTLGSLKVVVLLGPASFEVLDRRRDDTQYAVDVVLLVKCDPDNNAEVDSYVLLMEEIQAYFRAKDLTAGTKGVFCRAREFVNPAETLVDETILSDARTFVGAVRLRWGLRQ